MEAYQAAANRTVQKGKFQGCLLKDLPDEALDSIQRLRTRGTHAEFCRNFVAAK